MFVALHRDPRGTRVRGIVAGLDQRHAWSEDLPGRRAARLSGALGQLCARDPYREPLTLRVGQGFACTAAPRRLRRLAVAAAAGAPLRAPSKAWTRAPDCRRWRLGRAASAPARPW